MTSTTFLSANLDNFIASSVEFDPVYTIIGILFLAYCMEISITSLCSFVDDSPVVPAITIASV